MQRLNNKQEGISAFGITVVMLVMGLVIVVSLKLIPIYIENFTVVAALDSLQRDEKTLNMDGIKTRLMKNFQLNNIDTVRKQHITIKNLKHKKKRVTIEYEVRRSVMGNVDVVVHFVDSVELSGQ